MVLGFIPPVNVFVEFVRLGACSSFALMVIFLAVMPRIVWLSLSSVGFAYVVERGYFVAWLWGLLPLW